MKTRLIATVIVTFALFVSVAAFALFAPGAMAPTAAAEIPEAGSTELYTLDFGDAPEGALAYPSIGVVGQFPTCKTVGPATWIQHTNFGAFFGGLDFEGDGNAGVCPLFTPNQYDRDECFADGDAGLIMPEPFTIVGPVGGEQVVPCPLSNGTPLGSICQTAIWGQNIDIHVQNFMPSQWTGYVNVLIDWDKSGAWGGGSSCATANAPEHVLVDWPIPNGYNGPLSGLGPPAFLIGPNDGFVWARISITEYPVGANWDGSGTWEDGETEDYLLLVTQPGEWIKTIDGAPWEPQISVTVETSDTVVIKDTVIGGEAFEIEEEWNPDHLKLLDWQVDPNVGLVEVGDGFLSWKVEEGEALEGATLTKWFHVEPCDWTGTDLIERWWGSDGVMVEERVVHFEKTPPILTIASEYESEVMAGAEANFRLVYKNEGGYENAVMIRNEFPPEAPYRRADPPADYVSDDGLRAEWEIGDLASGDEGTIDVTVAIDASLVPSTTIEIWDWIYNHLGEPVDEVLTTFHIRPLEFGDAPEDGIAYPAAGVVGQFPTCKSIGPATWIEHASSSGWFGPLADWEKDGDAGLCPPPGCFPTYDDDECYQDDDAGLIVPEPFTIVGVAGQEQVVPCPNSQGTALGNICETANWGQEIDIDVNNGLSNQRKYANVLIDWDQGGSWGGTSPCVGAVAAEHVLKDFSIPAGYVGPLSGLNPPSFLIGPNDGYVWARFSLTDQPVGDEWDGSGKWEDGETEDYLLLVKKPPEWYKYIDGVEWNPDISVTVETSDTVVIMDRVFSGDAFEIEEAWDPDRLKLVDWAVEPEVGQVEVGDGFLSWKVEEGEALEGATLKKWFHVEPCDWTDTLLRELLWVGGWLVEERPVHFEKLPPELWINSGYEPEVLPGANAGFSLNYGNNGGYENDVMIRNEFPPEALYRTANPEPDRLDPNGTWAEWDLGDLSMFGGGNIDVGVTIDASLPPSTTIEIKDWIYNHLGEPVDEVITEFHVAEPEASDLGDAPDSSNNHGNIVMTAYSGAAAPVPARYPTIFAGPAPIGPKHWNHQSTAWLGPGISAEDEADIGPDQDSVNNIWPPTDTPDQDKFDDGVGLGFGRKHCVPTTITFVVTVPLGAPPTKHYANIWLDVDRNGAWGEVHMCQKQGDAPEWAVRDMEIPANAPGTYTYTTPQFMLWNLPLDVPVWMRVTLAEQPAPITARDGSGPANGYSSGETEDYYVPELLICKLYDFNDDHFIDLDDILEVLDNSIFNNAPYNARYDIVPDGVVDIADIFEVAIHFGEPCP